MYDFIPMDPLRYIRLALEATGHPGTGETQDEQELGFWDRIVDRDP